MMLNMVCTTAVLKDICVHLNKCENKTQEDGLNGNAGLVLLYFYFYRYSKNEMYYSKAVQILENIFERIDGNYLNSNFSNGIAGIGWLVDHLSENDFIDIDCDVLFADTIDAHIHHSMLADLYQESLVFDNGALGKCFYFIKRYQNTKSAVLKVRYKNYITQFIFFLERRRIYTDYTNQAATARGIRSSSKSAEINQNIGLVNILLHICVLVEFDVLVHPLLEKYSSSLTEKIQLSSFQKAEIALSLWKSGQILNKKSYLERSKQIVRHKIVSAENLQIMNYFKFGIVFQELSQSSSHDFYKELQYHWISKGCKELSGVGIQKLNAGLCGLSGIGMSLLTLENDSKTNWQECFLY
jgi:hypothetical protein